MMRFSTLLVFIYFSITSFSSCGTGTGALPSRQKVTDLTWSPDGQSLAFVYENADNSSDNNYIVYTIQSDGNNLKSIIQEKTRDLTYRIHHWKSPNKILTGDQVHLYELDVATGKKNLIFEFANKGSLGNPPPKRITGVCSFGDPNYIFVSHDSGIPFWFDLNLGTQLSPPSIKFSEKDPLPNMYGGTLNCSPFGDRAYLTILGIETAPSGSTPSQTNKFVELIADVNPSKGEMSNLHLIVSPKLTTLTTSSKDSMLSFSGWYDNEAFLYSVVDFSTLKSTFYRFKFFSNEIQEINDPKIVGGNALYTANYKGQKIAYFSKNEDTGEASLTVSNPDGSNKKQLLKINSLPRKELPL